MKKLRIAVSLPNESYYVREQAAAARRAAQQFGADVQVFFADSDPVSQSQQLLQLIQSRSTPHPDAILVEPVTQLGLPRVADAAVSAGIAWVVSNTYVDYMQRLRSSAKVPVFIVSQSQRGVGVTIARQVAALLPEGGSVLSIQGPGGSPIATERAEGMTSAMPRNIQVKAVRGQLTEDSACQSVSSWLRLSIARAAGIDLVACQTCDLAAGAKKAFKENTQGAERDRWLSLPYIGSGVASQAKPQVDQGILKAAVIVSTTLDHAVDILVRAIEKGVQPPEHTVIDESSYPALENLAKQRASGMAAGKTF